MRALAIAATTMSARQHAPRALKVQFIAKLNREFIKAQLD